MAVPVSRGFAVIRRINWFEDPPHGDPRPARNPSLALSHHEILARYRGIEGWLWPEGEGLEQIHLISGLAGEGEVSYVRRYFQEVRKRFHCDLVYCEVFDRVPSRVGLAACRKLLGFDYGYLRSETDCFSSLLNEVLYGTSETMRRWSAALNENLLLPSLDAAAMFHHVREGSVLAGEDLEVCGPDEVMQTVAVFDPDSKGAE